MTNKLKIEHEFNRIGHHPYVAPNHLVTQMKLTTQNSLLQYNAFNCNKKNK